MKPSDDISPIVCFLIAILVVFVALILHRNYCTECYPELAVDQGPTIAWVGSGSNQAVTLLYEGETYYSLATQHPDCRQATGAEHWAWYDPQGEKVQHLFPIGTDTQDLTTAARAAMDFQRIQELIEPKK